MPRQKKIELSPRLKLGVGRGYSQNRILKYGSLACLVLAVALGLNALRLVLRSGSEQTGGNAPQVLGAADAKQNDEIKFIEYKVVKGDTLFNIAQHFNVNWSTLATINNLKSPFPLKPGQILRIPQ
jgi:hypothetical protein